MHSEKTLRTFLAIGAALVSIYFCISASKNIYYYVALRSSTQAIADRFDIEETSSGRYALKVTYHFEAGGRLYQGETLLESPSYPNLPVAISEMRKLAAEHRTWTVWHESGHSQISSLERRFPTNLLWRALVAAIVSFYFCIGINKNIFKLELFNKRKDNF